MDGTLECIENQDNQYPETVAEELEGVAQEARVFSPSMNYAQDDPIKIYLREMESLSLLTKQGEIGIAKKMETGKARIAGIIFTTPFAIKQILHLPTLLKENKISINNICSLEKNVTDADKKRLPENLNDNIRGLKSLVQKLRSYHAKLDDRRLKEKEKKSVSAKVSAVNLKLVDVLSALNLKEEITESFNMQFRKRYYYRLRYRSAGETNYSATVEHTFHTQRAPGSTFTFSIQGDSHPERVNNMFESAHYSNTLLTATADLPDFYMAIGDDFSVDTVPTNFINQARAIERYTIQRPYLGLVADSASLFLVNGNHEQACLANYLSTNLVAPGVSSVTLSNIAVWAQNARNAYYPVPAPDAFYSGMTNDVLPNIGPLRSCYAWPACAGVERKTWTRADEDNSENSASVGILITYGAFRMLDLGDLTWNREMQLVCPDDLIGPVDLFMASHHGVDLSNNPALVSAVRPRVAVMNNGTRKGGAAWGITLLKAAPGLQALFQSHWSTHAGDGNPPGAFLANLQDSTDGNWIKIAAQGHGTMTVTNGRTGESTAYKR